MLMRQVRRTKTPISVEEQELAGLIFKESLRSSVSHKAEGHLYSKFSLFSISNPVILTLNNVTGWRNIYKYEQKATFSLNSCF